MQQAKHWDAKVAAEKVFIQELAKQGDREQSQISLLEG